MESKDQIKENENLDKSKIKDALTDSQDWLNANQDAEKEDFEDKLKELQAICDPIIQKVYQASGG